MSEAQSTSNSTNDVKRRLLVEANEQQRRRRRAARLAQRAVRLLHGGRIPRRRGTPARHRELRRKLAARKAARRTRVQETRDPPSPRRSDEPAVGPRPLAAWRRRAVARARLVRGERGSCRSRSRPGPGSEEHAGGEGSPAHEAASAGVSGAAATDATAAANEQTGIEAGELVDEGGRGGAGGWGRGVRHAGLGPGELGEGRRGWGPAEEVGVAFNASGPRSGSEMLSILRDAEKRLVAEVRLAPN